MDYNHRQQQDLTMSVDYKRQQVPGVGMSSIDSGVSVPNPFKNGAMMMKSVSEHSQDQVVMERLRSHGSENPTEENVSQAGRYIQEVENQVLDTGKGIGYSPPK